MSALHAPQDPGCDVLAVIDAIRALTRRLIDDLAVTVTYSAHPPAGGLWPHNIHADYDGDQRRLTIRADLPAPTLLLALQGALNLCILGPQRPPTRPPGRRLSLVPHPVNGE